MTARDDPPSIPWRCSHCHSLLTRTPARELWAELGDRHSYMCQVCHHSFAVNEVNSGRFDVRETLLHVPQLSGSPPYDLADLLGYFRGCDDEDHENFYFYRGEMEIWPRPLVPSTYRGYIQDHPTVNAPMEYRLRDLGNVFYAVNDQAIRAITEIERKKALFEAYLWQWFGYPMGNILAQQCGLKSEGLDISHYPDVAAFFAIFDYSKEQFCDDGLGVIYRFAVPKNLKGNSNYSTASFYDSISLLSSLLAFHQLRKFSEWNEARSAFEIYKYAIHQKFETDWDQTRPMPRPLHLLGFPEYELATCRIVQQAAALLLPDVILSEQWKLERKKPPIGKAEWKGPLLVEDISTRHGVERYEFRHSPNNKYIVPRSPRILYPTSEGIKRFLMEFCEAFADTVLMTDKAIFRRPDIDLIE